MDTETLALTSCKFVLTNFDCAEHPSGTWWTDSFCTYLKLTVIELRTRRQRPVRQEIVDS